MNQSAQHEPQDNDSSQPPSDEQADQAPQDKAEEGREAQDEGGEEESGAEEGPREPLTRVECPAVKGYDNPAVRWMIIGIVAFGLGVYCLIDAFIVRKYPYPEPFEVNQFARWAFNIFGTFFFIPAGILAVTWTWKLLKQVLVADQEGIGYAGREQIPWGDITELDGSRVEKGLLVLKSGEDEKLVLDSWKLKNFRDLVAIIEQHVPEDKQVK